VTDAARHRTSLDVRFRDIDAFGHVNNAVFFSYVEQARIRYLLDVIRPDTGFDRMPLILARVELDFRSPIMFGDRVSIETQVDRVGRSSIAMSHRMTAGDGPDERVVADVATVLVTYDYATARPIPVPDAWRERFAAHEGRQLVADAPRATAAASA
jgi:acyl-CoA thioester hydrolase